MKKETMTLVALAALALPGFANQVQITSDGRPDRIFRPARGLDNEDARFLHQALVSDQFELICGNLALRNGTGDFTREFAKEMLVDHQAAKDEAVQTAKDRGITPDADLPQPLQAQINHMSKLHGTEFDQAYRHVQEVGHEMTIHAYKNEIENGHDDLVKAMAVKELPTVELHYRMLLEKKTMMGDTAAKHGS